MSSTVLVKTEPADAMQNAPAMLQTVTRIKQYICWSFLSAQSPQRTTLLSSAATPARIFRANSAFVFLRYWMIIYNRSLLAALMRQSIRFLSCLQMLHALSGSLLQWSGTACLYCLPLPENQAADTCTDLPVLLRSAKNCVVTWVVFLCLEIQLTHYTESREQNTLLLSSFNADNSEECSFLVWLLKH